MHNRSKRYLNPKPKDVYAAFLDLPFEGTHLDILEVYLSEINRGLTLVHKNKRGVYVSTGYINKNDVN